jgi:hypothetical protein
VKPIVSDSVERDGADSIASPYNAIIYGSKIDLDYLFHGRRLLQNRRRHFLFLICSFVA